MGFTLEIKNNILIAHFYGELDQHLAEKARTSIDKKYLESNMKNIIIDFSQLSLMDSSGIGLIMGRYKNVSHNKGKLMVVSSNVYVDRIIRMSGLLKIIDVFENTEAALEKLGE